MPAWLHPMLVHFAIGLLFAAVALDVAGLWRRSEKLLFAGYYNTVLGAAAALLALATGFAAQSALGPRTEAALALLGFHKLFAVPAALVAAALAVARVAMKGYIRPRTRTPYLVFAFLCGGLTLLAGVVGGVMVYGYGMGLTPAAAGHVLAAQPSAPPAPGAPLLSPSPVAPREPPAPPEAEAAPEPAPEPASGGAAARAPESGKAVKKRQVARPAATPRPAAAPPAPGP